MSSWGLLLAASGVRYSAPRRHLEFAAAASTSLTWPWFAGDAWGSVQLRPGPDWQDVTITGFGGELTIDQFALTNFGTVQFRGPALVSPERALHFRVDRAM